jgi:hypothetical protein
VAAWGNQLDMADVDAVLHQFVRLPGALDFETGIAFSCAFR